VTFTYRSSGGAAEAAAKALAADHPGRRFAALRVDLSDRDAVAAFAAELGDDAHYDGFVHNAGHTYDALAMMMDQAKAEVAMQVKLLGVHAPCERAGAPDDARSPRPHRRDRLGDGAAGKPGQRRLRGFEGCAAGYARTLAIEVARTGVTVNYVAPGFIDTEMLAPYAKFRDTMEGQIPARRFAAPEEIASVVAFPDVARRVIRDRCGAARGWRIVGVAGGASILIREFPGAANLAGKFFPVCSQFGTAWRQFARNSNVLRQFREFPPQSAPGNLHCRGREF